MKEYFHWLDLTRFLAALSVVITHATTLFLPEYEDLPVDDRNIIYHCILVVLKQGHMAVICFFILSGFFVGGRCLEKIMNKSISIKSYCIDRFVRIMLPLIPSLLLVFIMNNYLGRDICGWDYIGNLFSLQGIVCKPVSGPFWSLSYEVWCYIFMLGVALMFCERNDRSNIKICKSGGVFITLLCFTVFTLLKEVYIFIWFLGTICYFAYKNKLFSCVTTKKLWTCAVLIWLILSDIIIKMFFNIEEIRIVFELLFGFLFSLFILFLINNPPSLKKARKVDSWGMKLAKFSYTLYLSHYAILQFCASFWSRENRINMYSITGLLGSVAIAVFSAYILYFLGEKHTTIIKQTIKKIWLSKSLML